MNLEQLFVQAACAEPLLRGKVLKWAAVCGGMFPVEVSESPTGEQFRPILVVPECDMGEEEWDLAYGPKYIRGDDPALLQAGVEAVESGTVQGLRIKWAHLKSASRATEKLVRSYGQVS